MFLLTWLRDLLSRTANPGDRIRISVQCDVNPEWPCDAADCEGEITALIAVTGGAPAAVVRLERPLTARGVTSRFVLLHPHDVWRRRGGVHVELLGMAAVYQRLTKPGPERWIGRDVTYERVPMPN